MPDDFYDYPELFDALLPAHGHIELYRRLAAEHPGALLQLACGTGQLTVPLASTGASVVGLDMSGSMLRVAKTRVREAGASVALVRGDMRRFAFGLRFGLIVIARNSLLHMLSDDDFVAVLRASADHLAPRGVLAFDIFNPNPRLLAKPRGERSDVFRTTSPAFGELSVEATPDYDPRTQINRATWHISTPEKRDAWTVPMVLRSVFPQDLPALVSAAGLELIDRFGDLDRSPFGPASRLQVCLCRRAG